LFELSVGLSEKENSIIEKNSSSHSKELKLFQRWGTQDLYMTGSIPGDSPKSEKEKRPINETTLSSLPRSPHPI
jgi:hypothetical protein